MRSKETSKWKTLPLNWKTAVVLPELVFLEPNILHDIPRRFVSYSPPHNGRRQTEVNSKSEWPPSHLSLTSDLASTISPAHACTPHASTLYACTLYTSTPHAYTNARTDKRINTRTHERTSPRAHGPTVPQSRLCITAVSGGRAISAIPPALQLKSG